MPQRTVVGVVTSDKMAKTRRVDVNYVVQHSKYGKFIRRKTVCYMHDENNDAGLGDTVRIRECPPKSRLKRWELVEIISKSQEVDIAALKAAHAMAAEEAAQRAAEEAAAEGSAE